MFPKSTAKILVVDDHPSNLLALEAVLQPLGHQVLRATSGNEALKQLLNEEIAFVILDVMMPEINGFDLARLLKEHERTRFIPILFLTAVGTGESHIRKGYAEGAVDYLLKPLDPDILRAKAKFCLDLHLARKAAETAQRRASFLAQASAALSESLDYRAILAKIANLAVPAFADWCSVALVQADKSLCRVALVHRDAQKQSLAQDYEKRFSPVFDKSPELRTVLLQRKAVLVSEVQDSQLAAIAENPEHLQLLRDLGISSFIIAPLSTRENLLGVITLIRSEPTNPYLQADLALAEDLAARSALAIENARLYEAERRRADFEEQLIGIVSHDLRNPLSVIAMAAASIERGVDVGERYKRSANRIISAADRANRLIRDWLDFTRSRKSGHIPVDRRPVDFHVLTKELIDEIGGIRPNQRIELVQSGNGFGEWDPDRLEQIIENLVQNALNYSSPGGPIRVETQGQAESVLLTVHNRGEPIPVELLPELFKPLKRGQGKVDPRTTSIGLGLYIVEQIVLAHGGRIAVKSLQEEGTTFTVHLPRRAEAQLVEPIERRSLPREVRASDGEEPKFYNGR